MATPPYNKYDIRNNKLGWDKIAVVFKGKKGVYSLQEVVGDESLMQEYFTQYASSESGDFYLDHRFHLDSMGIETTVVSDIAEKLAEAGVYFKNIVLKDGKIDESLFEFDNFQDDDKGGHVSFSPPDPDYNAEFYHDFYEIQVNYRQTKGARGVDYINDKSYYFSKLLEDINKETPTIEDFAIWLFIINPKAIEALRKSSEEILKVAFEDEGWWAQLSLSKRKEVALLTEAKKGTYAEKVVLEKVNAHKAGLDSEEVDEAGFGTKRLWSEQCLLNSNFHKLAKFHKGEFLNTYAANSSHLFPKKNKTYFIESKQPSSLINQLTSVPGSQIFLNMKNDKYSNLLPRIQLYSINYSRNNDKEKTVNRKEPIIEKIIFPQNAQVFEGRSIVGRGDYGIKSFSWDLIGSNPRTQRNDIQAELTLYFQSLDQIFGKNVNNNLLKLLKRPPSRIREETKDSLEDKKDNKSCGNTEISNSSGPKTIPEYYELKVDVGWRKANNSSALTAAEKTAVNNQRLSLYLTLIDHTFNFSQDGTFTLSLTYRGRVEELLSKQVADALATPKFKMERQIIKIIKNYASSESKKSDKSKEKLKSFSELVQDHNADFKRNAFSDIIDDMSNKNKIFYSRLPTSEFADFINEGKDLPFEPNKNFFTMSDILGNDDTAANLRGASSGFQAMLDKQRTIEENNENEEGSSPSDSFRLGDDQYFFSFFFLGDLLDTLFERSCKFEPMQSVIDEYLGTESSAGKAGFLLTSSLLEKAKDEVARKLQQNNVFYQQMKNTKLILGSLPLSRAVEGSSDCETTVYNISQVPISTKLFKDWFAHKVVDRDIDVYPFTQFARDLIKELALYSLQSNCEEVQKTNIIFKSTSLTGRRPIEKAANFVISDPTPELKGTHAENYVFAGVQGVINFNQSESEEQKAHSVIIIYAEDSSIKNLTGDYNEDIKSGIHHLNYGRDRGIVKQIQFTKNDVPGLREAKFSRDSLNPLAELSTIYNTSITTVGNVIFWPGQKVFVNPLGMGSSVGHPSDRGSVSGVLGLGGYYVLADVRSTIDSSSFTTTLRAIWETSGQRGKSSTNHISTNINPLIDPDIALLEKEEDK